MDFKNLLSHNLTKCKLTAVVVLCFAMATLTGFVTANKNVTIVADGNKMVVNTVYDNPKNILKQAGIKLDNGDDYTVSTGNITDNAVITINRAMPVTVEIDGEPWFVGKDVAAALGYTNSRDAIATHVFADDKGG